MEKQTGKQLLIQFGMQLITSAIVSYVMYRILEKKASPKTKVATQTVAPPEIVQTAVEEVE